MSVAWEKLAGFAHKLMTGFYLGHLYKWQVLFCASYEERNVTMTGTSEPDWVYVGMSESEYIVTFFWVITTRTWYPWNVNSFWQD